MKKYVAGTGITALLVLVALWVVDARVAQAPRAAQGCTEEAKICPDGSAVGRTGPGCEFAQCPSSSPVSIKARIGQEVSGLDVRIIPLEVIEDSRCPVNVACIQAGTVRMRARLISGLGEARQEFKLGQPITTEAERVILTRVSPEPRAGVRIESGDYVFHFEIAKR